MKSSLAAKIRKTGVLIKVVHRADHALLAGTQRSTTTVKARKGVQEVEDGEAWMRWNGEGHTGCSISEASIRDDDTDCTIQTYNHMILYY